MPQTIYYCTCARFGRTRFLVNSRTNKMSGEPGEFRTSRLDFMIDYTSLKVELEDALRSDELYKLQNDAKLRAVEQNVPTYDAFRQMVNAAHLRPLERDDCSFKAKGGSFWNPVATNDRSKPQNNRNSNVRIRNERLDAENAENSGLLTCEQFTRAWKTIEDREAKFRYLDSFKDLFAEKIFRRGIPSPLFTDFMDLCHEMISTTDNVASIVEILSALSKCDRFSLTISFMAKKEKETCTQLFDRLIDHANQHGGNLLLNAIESLRLIYIL
ncbi:dynein axonemal assembly factor 19 [Megalopta genalis]|uniref:dynein axonemal assembly factor 19 n=1 Tax=Megalopta genalis TaxID=115081 RepID=UPI003FD129EE